MSDDCDALFEFVGDLENTVALGVGHVGTDIDSKSSLPPPLRESVGYVEPLAGKWLRRL